MFFCASWLLLLGGRRTTFALRLSGLNHFVPPVVMNVLREAVVILG
jgi:hypothetical protein